MIPLRTGIPSPEPSGVPPFDRIGPWPLVVEFIDGKEWRVFRDISYRTDAGEISTVREGFVFDFASIPRLLWVRFPPAGDGKNLYGLAAAWHDWLYIHRKIGGRAITRKEADDLFLEIMLYLGVRPWIAHTMHRAVRAFGWTYWR